MKQLAPELPYPVFLIEDLSEFTNWIGERRYAGLRLLADENTLRYCYPKFTTKLIDSECFIIPAGEHNKHLETCQTVWEFLSDTLAGRNHCLLNVGGGVVGDLGGFVAGTFKRGIPFIQMPTSLLAMVDASVGGKVGIDFRWYKNQIGLFARPQAVFIYPDFLETLPIRELRSGLAEIIKHHLIADKESFHKLTKTPEEELSIVELIEHSVQIKASLILKDEFDNNHRKCLNFGHTVGHALESYFLSYFPKQSLLHGEAIAVGILAESYLSYVSNYISPIELEQIVELILRYFSIPFWEEAADDIIFGLMKQDKKNTTSGLKLVLLSGLGNAIVDIHTDYELIKETLRFVQSLRESER